MINKNGGYRYNYCPDDLGIVVFSIAKINFSNKIAILNSLSSKGFEGYHLKLLQATGKYHENCSAFIIN